ncbi:YicC/YloC family endoribonuclease [Sneathiella sp.]|uniref:YicC/YloC family endoribonuclease n=1 Tax=Sneathiella sp. TaxID=1964365 RepID=UPI003567DD6A
MTVNSMTGFARIGGSHGDTGWLWEMKSVNGRGLEIRCRMPAGLDQLEDRLRKLVKAHFQRGSINLHLQFETAAADSGYRVNETFLDELLSLAADYVDAGRARRPRMDGMLALRGVIEQTDTSAGVVDDALEAALFASAEELVAVMGTMREEEGRQLLPVLTAQLDEIERLVDRAIGFALKWPDNARAKIKAQMELILDGGQLDPGRLEQELAMLTTKADISEELDRLASHIISTREMLAGPSAAGVGRRLDFICQEFNREANTLCSKANDKELTQVGLDMKVVVDRLREQIQNIE